jgi:type I restriction enzyme M protein
VARGRPKQGETKAKKNGNGANVGFETELFLAADKLRKNLEPSDYKHVVLGLIFLRHISQAFEAKRKALLAEDASAAEDPDEYLAENIFWVPKDARSCRQTPGSPASASWSMTPCWRSRRQTPR